MKIVLGLAGEIASGKGTVARYIIEKHQGNSHRFSTMLRDIAKRMHLEESRENLQKISTIFRQNFHDDILSEVIAGDVKEDGHKIISIDGVRRLADIAYLTKLPEFKLVYIDADMDKRYERIIKRGENSDDTQKTFEEFKRDHEKEAELQIRELKNQADFVVDNNGNFESLYGQIDQIIEKAK
ncbi:MAG: AAA family ATPase [Candidatus Moranbacteria bacterium]|nr:AAA family ATPase [Candidatus Moranbacteria bacterium]